MVEKKEVSVEYGTSKKWPQIVAAFTATIGAFGLGTALAWTSPALPHLDSSLCGDACDVSDVSRGEAAWIGALAPLGALMSGPVTGFLMSSVGRRWTMISYSVPFAVGYGLFALACEVDNKVAIFIGRICTGFAGGAFALAAPLYIVEIAEPSMRGSLASLMQLMVTLGVAFVSGLNIKDFAHWNVISMICIALPVLLAVFMFLMPESPTFLVITKEDEQAKKALQWLRGPNYNVSFELEQLKSDLKNEREERGTLSWCDRLSKLGISLKDMFTKAVYLKPFLVILALMFFQQFSGINEVIFYSQEIFRDAGSDMDPGLASFVVALSMVGGTAIAVLIVDWFGRKILLFLSAVFMCLTIMALAVFFFLKENSPLGCKGSLEECDSKFSEKLIKDLGWLPLTSLILYVIAFSIGFGPLPWTVNAEIFSSEAKGVASALAFCFNWFCAFIVTKFFPQLKREINPSGVYFLCAGVCAMATLFVLLVVPETKGRSAEELKQLFEGRRKSKEELRGRDNKAFDTRF